MATGKKFLFFVGGSYVYGLEIVTFQLMKELKENGFEVRCIVSGWNDGIFKQMLDEQQIKYYEVKLGWLHLRKPLWTIDTLLHFPKAFYKCKKIIKDYNPDILHFSSYPTAIMLYPLLKGKIVFALHDTHQPTLKHTFIFKWLNKKINLFIGVSNHIAKSLAKLGIPQNKITVIYNGVYNPGNILHLNKFKNTIIHFAIIGQVAPWKGHETLVEAVDFLVKKNITGFKILIFGNQINEFGKKLKDIILKKNLLHFFIWKGFVKNQDDIYKLCDAVIVPSLSEEPCSLTVIESMMRGKQLIVSDRGGNPELIEHNINGFVFKADDPVALSERMQQIIINPDKTSDFGLEARQKALSHHTLQCMVNQYVEAYNSL